MLFARLAVAVLSFSSAVTVFAAPISVFGVEIGVTVDSSKIQRRALFAVPDAVRDAASTLGPLKDKIVKLASTTGSVTPEILSTLSMVNSALGPVSEAMSNAGLDKDAILTMADGTMTSPDAMVEDISTMYNIIEAMLGSIKDLKSLELAKNSITNMQQRITDIQAGFEAPFPKEAKSLEVPVNLGLIVVVITI